MAFIGVDRMQPKYESVLIGSGFGAMFFAHEHLKHRRAGRVLMLEWGAMKSREWQIANEANSIHDSETLYHRPSDQKFWHFTVGFGGGTNCWWAISPRNHPHDFELRTRYGVGLDWPYGYDELAPYYKEAERIMLVSGPDDLGRLYPGLRAYPQPPHRLSAPDRLMKAAQPDRHFALPNSRLRVPVGSRAACCATGTCQWCPQDAKFTALNTFGEMFEHPNLDILCEARVTRLDREGNRIRGVVFEHAGREHVVECDLCVLGANGLFSPVILLQSGFSEPPVGRFLHEKIMIEVEVFLDGLDGLDGSTIVSGMNTTLVAGDHRRTGGGGLLYFASMPNYGLRAEYGRWRQILPINIDIEDLPLEASRVTVGANDLPAVDTPRRSQYGLDGVKHALESLPEILAPLPVERIEMRDDAMKRSVHLQGTLRMGADPSSSVVDAGQIHHQVRNLMVVGTAVFPTAGTATPSLTCAAMSIRAARRLEA